MVDYITAKERLSFGNKLTDLVKKYILREEIIICALLVVLYNIAILMANKG
jgi:hypothetical protein